MADLTAQVAVLTLILSLTLATEADNSTIMESNTNTLPALLTELLDQSPLAVIEEAKKDPNSVVKENETITYERGEGGAGRIRDNIEEVIEVHEPLTSGTGNDSDGKFAFLVAPDKMSRLQNKQGSGRFGKRKRRKGKKRNGRRRLGKAGRGAHVQATDIGHREQSNRGEEAKEDMTFISRLVANIAQEVMFGYNNQHGMFENIDNGLALSNQLHPLGAAIKA